MSGKIISLKKERSKREERVHLEIGREPEQGFFVAYWPAFPIFSASGNSPEAAMEAFEVSFPALNVLRP